MQYAILVARLANIDTCVAVTGRTYNINTIECSKQPTTRNIMWSWTREMAI